MSTATQTSDRYARGRDKLAEVDGSAGEAIVDSLGDLGRHIVEYAFGDVYSRPGLSLRDRELATVAMLAAKGGCEPQLDVHLHAARNLGSPSRSYARCSSRSRPTPASRPRSTPCAASRHCKPTSKRSPRLPRSRRGRPSGSNGTGTYDKALGGARGALPRGNGLGPFRPVALLVARREADKRRTRPALFAAALPSS
jgi:hypothetical protein